jgi:membrane protein DedA with SNARE-associated domain
MNLELLLHQFGYLAIFAGTFLEGETVLVLAGFLASRGELSLPPVVLVAAAGAYSGHVFWFFLGRRRGTRLVHRFPRFEQHIARSLKLVDRHGAGAIFISQYLYGLRIASAVVFGISPMEARKFLLYQALSCALWACLIGSLGYFFGLAVEQVLGRAVTVERYALAAILFVAGGIFVYHRLRQPSSTSPPGPLS